VTHWRSFKVTHTKNAFGDDLPAGNRLAISSTPKACGLQFHHPRKALSGSFLDWKMLQGTISLYCLFEPST